MPDEKHFLCSQLVRVSTGRAAEVGNLEEISAAHCVVAVQHGLPAGTHVMMQCLECPAGKHACIECVFRGHVECTESNPEMGCLMEVAFEQSEWSERKWKPLHMVELKRAENSDLTSKTGRG